MYACMLYGNKLTNKANIGEESVWIFTFEQRAMF